jgi:hypothetical protein
VTPEVRIGDVEREQAVSALGEHYAAGRLTKDEFDERAAAAWAARTESGLRPLFVDLPAPHGRTTARENASRPAPGATPRRPPRRRGPGIWSMLPVFPILVGLFLLALLTPFPWFPFWVLLGLAWFVRAGWGGRRRAYADPSWGRRGAGSPWCL